MSINSQKDLDALRKIVARCLQHMHAQLEPGILTAQYEHTMVITKGKPLIMTLPA